MPSRKEHVEHCKELYGYGFEKIHAWMDGTVRSKGAKHRMDRHNPYKTPNNAYEIFEDKVPKKYRKYIKDAVKDHIELDKRESRGKRLRRLKMRKREDVLKDERPKKERYSIMQISSGLALLGGADSGS